jgi:hypothetical protein
MSYTKIYTVPELGEGDVSMTTTELIELLTNLEHGASGRAREISLVIKIGENSHFLSEPQIIVDGSGDGVAGAELSLLVFNKRKMDTQINLRSGFWAKVEFVDLCIQHCLVSSPIGWDGFFKFHIPNKDGSSKTIFYSIGSIRSIEPVSKEEALSYDGSA